MNRTMKFSDLVNATLLILTLCRCSNNVMGSKMKLDKDESKQEILEKKSEEERKQPITIHQLNCELDEIIKRKENLEKQLDSIKKNNEEVIDNINKYQDSNMGRGAIITSSESIKKVLKNRITELNGKIDKVNGEIINESEKKKLKLKLNNAERLLHLYNELTNTVEYVSKKEEIMLLFRKVESLIYTPIKNREYISHEVGQIYFCIGEGAILRTIDMLKGKSKYSDWTYQTMDFLESGGYLFHGRSIEINNIYAQHYLRENQDLNEGHWLNDETLYNRAQINYFVIALIQSYAGYFLNNYEDETRFNKFLYLLTKYSDSISNNKININDILQIYKTGKNAIDLMSSNEFIAFLKEISLAHATEIKKMQPETEKSLDIKSLTSFTAAFKEKTTICIHIVEGLLTGTTEQINLAKQHEKNILLRSLMGLNELNFYISYNKREYYTRHPATKLTFSKTPYCEISMEECIKYLKSLSETLGLQSE